MNKIPYAALAFAAVPFVAGQMGHEKAMVGLAAAYVVGDWIYYKDDPNPYTPDEAKTLGIYAAGIALAFWKPKLSLVIAAGLLAVDLYRANRNGDNTN